MPYIRSTNPDVPRRITHDPSYLHGADSRKGYIPLVFQITSPFDPRACLLPHALVAHVNPLSFGETFTKKVERIQTRGGFVEQHWGDDLGEIQADSSTGAFVNLYEGLSSVARQRTIAWDRYRDLHDLFKNNGSVYDPYGNIVLQGNVMLLYDRGTYLGYFRSFEVEETDESPFAFTMNWSFKVEKTIYQIPQNQRGEPIRAPAFQSKNQTNATSLSLPGAGVPEDGRTGLERIADNLKQEAFGDALRAGLEKVLPQVPGAVSRTAKAGSEAADQVFTELKGQVSAAIKEQQESFVRLFGGGTSGPTDKGGASGGIKPGSGGKPLPTKR